MRFPQLSPEKAAPLLDMPSGSRLMVEELTGSPALRSKLYAMGILPGTEIEVCRQSCGKGSVCVRVRQCSLVLGESLARAIHCRAAGHQHQRRRRHHAWPWFGRGGACPEPDGTDVLEVRECGCPRSECGADHGKGGGWGRRIKEN